MTRYLGKGAHDKEIARHTGKITGKSLKKPKDPIMTTTMFMANFSWGSTAKQPENLFSPYESKGQWTYPKKGFIQWKNKK